jgi:hypothetical protein
MCNCYVKSMYRKKLIEVDSCNGMKKGANFAFYF